MEETKPCKCPACEEREQKEAAMEETNLAVLLALVPMLAITLFSQVGFF